jgi:hypothetical protein
MKAFDYNETAKAYVNIAAVLAAFAFSAVVLLIDKSYDSEVHKSLKSISTVSMLLGFYGCLISALCFSVISGEKNFNKGLILGQLIGGSAFTSAGIFTFYGLITLLKIYFKDDIINLSNWLLFLVLIFVIIYLILGYLDLYHSYIDENYKFVRKIIAQFLTPFVVFCLVKILLGLYNVSIPLSYFSYYFIINAILMTLECIAALLCISVNESNLKNDQLYKAWIIIKIALISFIVLF